MKKESSNIEERNKFHASRPPQNKFRTARSRPSGWDKAQKIRWGKLAPRRQKSVKEEAEFGLGKEELTFCSGCGIVYYHKSWHHRLEDFAHLNEEKSVKFTLCPACRMIKDRIFEGELIISGTKTRNLLGEIKRVLKNSGDLAFERDPLDRIISIKDQGGKLIVHTTENQLAVRLGKKIELTFHGKMKVLHSREEDVIRVKLDLD